MYEETIKYMMKTLRTMDLSQFFVYPDLMNLLFTHNCKAPSRDSGVNEQGDYLTVGSGSVSASPGTRLNLLFYSIINIFSTFLNFIQRNLWLWLFNLSLNPSSSSLLGIMFFAEKAASVQASLSFYQEICTGDRPGQGLHSGSTCESM